MNIGVVAVAPRVKIADKASLKCLVRVRMGEHPKVFVAKANGTQLQCLYCKKFLVPKKSNIDEHLKTVMHIDAIVPSKITEISFSLHPMIMPSISL